MRTLYFDCFSGVSGDMLVAAMIDIGVPVELILDGLGKLPVMGYTVETCRENKKGISARRFIVTLENEHHGHRNLEDIVGLIADSGLSENVKGLALEIFREIAAAEGRVHGVPAGEVTFHEVGAADSIVDITAAAICFDRLAPDRVVFSKLREGSGFVRCAHGMIPVPAPATLEILSRAGIPVEFTEVDGEMVTPTGAAIAAVMGDAFGESCPSGVISAVGYGGGTKDFPHANVLRAVLVNAGGKTDSGVICVLESTIDDSSGEELGFAVEHLFRAGCLDAYYSPVYMKKNRPGITLTVLCEPEDAEKMENVIFRHTSTVGLRKRISERRTLERRIIEVTTEFGKIPVKLSLHGGAIKYHPEFEAVREAAMRSNVSVREVTQLVLNKLLQPGNG